MAAASGDRPIQNDFGGSPNDLNDFYRALCKKLSFFTIETAKADAPIHDNLGALSRRLHERKTKRMGHRVPHSALAIQAVRPAIHHREPVRANLRAPEIGLPLLGGPRKPRARTSFHGPETK